MNTRLVLAAVATTVLINAWACVGPDRPVSLYEGPDRPGGQKTEGPPPPDEFKFGPGHRVASSLDDGGLGLDAGVPTFEYVDNGEVIGTGLDTNGDGRVDVYRRISHGVVVEEVRDRNFDGILDQRSRDTNGDGKLDLLEPLTP